MKANVLIVDDDDSLRRALTDRLVHWGHAVTTAATGDEALATVAKMDFDLILLDLQMPGLSGMQVLAKLGEDGCPAAVVVLTAYGSVGKAVEAMKAGADDFLPKPADFAILKKVVDRILDRRRLQRVNRSLVEQIRGDSQMVVGGSPVMAALLETTLRAAASPASLLICGDSGTGKQVLAELVHRRSPRANGPFVYINCVAISDELIESTLFGHEKGAFTGAVAAKEGRLETAAGGTAFLDEIGDISPKLQAKLLHFLESGEFDRVGGTRTKSVDCRVLAATNRDLAAEVEAGRFREDLYYRLNVITLVIPPLRERREDIPLLAKHFLERFGGELKRDGLAFSEQTLKVLRAYGWPGNVRQLKNAIERMAVLSPDNTLVPELLPPEILGRKGTEDGDPLDLPYKEAIRRFKGQLVRNALAKVRGNQTQAAAELGIQRTYLNRLIKELELGI